MLEPLATASAQLTASGQRPRTDAVSELQRFLSDTPRAGPAGVKRRAESAERELGAWLDDLQAAADRDSLRMPLPASRISELLRTVLSKPANRDDVAGLEWEQAVQQYLAAEALYAGLGDVDPRSRSSVVKGQLLKVRQVLRFPAGYDAPLNFAPGPYFDALRGVRDALNLSGERP
jgi:hypothetical protein